MHVKQYKMAGDVFRGGELGNAHRLRCQRQLLISEGSSHTTYKRLTRHERRGSDSAWRGNRAVAARLYDGRFTRVPATWSPVAEVKLGYEYNRNSHCRAERKRTPPGISYPFPFLHESGAELTRQCSGAAVDVALLTSPSITWSNGTVSGHLQRLIVKRCMEAGLCSTHFFRADSTLTHMTIQVTQLRLNSNPKFANLTQLRLNSKPKFTNLTQHWLNSFDSELNQIWLTTHHILPNLGKSCWPGGGGGGLRSNVTVGWFFLCKVTDNCKILTFSPRKIIDSTLTQAVSSWLNSDSNDGQRNSTLTRLISLIFTADSTLTRLIWVRVESNLTHDSWVEHNPAWKGTTWNVKQLDRIPSPPVNNFRHKGRLVALARRFQAGTGHHGIWTPAWRISKYVTVNWSPK